LEYFPHPEHRTVFADSLALSQIFDNLLSNAIKYSYQNTVVTVRTSEEVGQDKRFIVVHFQDQGPGLTESDKEKLFQKFQRLSAKPTAGEHSNGLGLSIVKRLAESMGCTITVTSEFGTGAIFSLWIPSSSAAATVE
jgi:signal transduction histidine kinase